MSAATIQERTVDIIADIFNEDPGAIADETDFVDDLHAKSIDIVALVAALEEEFGLSISVSDVQDNRTVGEAVAWLENEVEAT